MSDTKPYAIGTPGTPWGDREKTAWLLQQKVKRSYSQQVVDKLEVLKDRFDIEQYGALLYSPNHYPLYAAKSRQWDQDKATVLVTGGVHGYETSGVQGAIRFLETRAQNYCAWFNIVVAPCVSPWGYETINRWNPIAVDPNRSFRGDSPSGGDSPSEDIVISIHFQRYSLQLTGTVGESGTCTCELRINRPKHSMFTASTSSSQVRLSSITNTQGSPSNRLTYICFAELRHACSNR